MFILLTILMSCIFNFRMNSSANALATPTARTVSEEQMPSPDSTDATDEDADHSSIKELISSIHIGRSAKECEEKATSDYKNTLDYEALVSILPFEYYDTYGSLIIPSADISLGLQYVDEHLDDTATAQNATDKENCAAWMPMGDAVYIADHVTQEFEKLYDCKVGDLAYIDNGKQVTVYKCTRREFGTNETDYIADAYGNNLSEEDVYVMYTCTDNSYNILLTFWEPIE